MITERYVVTCALENHDRPYYNAVSADECTVSNNTYKFYGVREIGMLEHYEEEAKKYAWDLARMIANSPEYGNLYKIFGVDSIDDVLNMPFDEVLKICQEWENRIKTGDVCLAKRSDGKTERVVVISAGDPESPDVLVLRNNLQTVLVDKDALEQTGESMANELDYILKALQEEEKMKEVRAYIFGLVDGVLIGVGCVDIVFAWLVARGKINPKMLDPKYVRENYIYKPHYERTRDPFWSSTYRDKWRQYHYRHPNPYATCDHCIHEMRDKEIYPCRVCFDHDHFMHAADSDVPNTLFDMPCSECAKWNDGKRDEMCALCRTSPSGVKLYFEEKEAEAVEEEKGYKEGDNT